MAIKPERLADVKSKPAWACARHHDDTCADELPGWLESIVNFIDHASSGYLTAARDCAEKRKPMGNPFCHIELSTGDVAAAKRFYNRIFDWKLTDVPMGPMTYTLINVGKGVGGGMQAVSMPGQPTAWLPYVEVASVKKTLDKARAAGATIVVGYTPIPGTGAIGIFVDPAGAGLGVWEPAAKVPKPAPKAKAKSAAKAKPAAKAKTKPAKKAR